MSYGTSIILVSKLQVYTNIYISKIYQTFNLIHNLIHKKIGVSWAVNYAMCNVGTRSERCMMCTVCMLALITSVLPVFLNIDTKCVLSYVGYIIM